MLLEKASTCIDFVNRRLFSRYLVWQDRFKSFYFKEVMRQNIPNIREDLKWNTLKRACGSNRQSPICTGWQQILTCNKYAMPKKSPKTLYGRLQI
jgi:hypothetical protein